MMMNEQSSPLLVGTIALDITYVGPQENPHTVDMRFGGAEHNSACILGVLGCSPRLITPRFTGEVGALAEHQLNYHKIQWTPLDIQTHLSYFHTYLDDEGVPIKDYFIDNGGPDAMTPEVLLRNEALFKDTPMLLTTTNLHPESIHCIQEICHQHSIDFWLLSGCLEKIPKMKALSHRPDFLSVNVHEFQALTESQEDIPEQVALKARSLVSEKGSCLITFGAKGALLVVNEERRAYFQTTPPLSGPSTLGAGDVFCGSLMAAYLNPSLASSERLQFATKRTLAYLMRDPYQRSHYFDSLQVNVDIPEVKEFNLS